MTGVLCLALAGGGCRGGPDDAIREQGHGGAPATAVSADEVARQIEAAGIGVVDSVTDPAPPTTLTLTRHQLDRMAEEVTAGSGVLGSELDAVAPVPDDLPPLSAWLGAWLHERLTPRAELVAGWYPDDTDWHMAPQLLFSRTAILLFVADVADDLDTNAPPLDPDRAFSSVEPSLQSSAPAFGVGSAVVLTAVSQDAPMAQVGTACEVITSFFANQITTLFNALRVSPAFLGEGPFGFIGGILAALWDTAIDIASATAVGLVRNLTAPIVEAIAGAVAVAGIVSHVATYVTGWNIELTADPPETAFAVGAAPDQLGAFEVGPGTGHRPWQPDLEQCARATGVTLPRLLEPGSPVEWTVTENHDIIGASPPATPLIIERSRDDRIPASERPRLEYRTNREDSDQGPPGFGLVTASARAPRAELQQVLTLARDQIDATLGRIASAAVPVPGLAALAGQRLRELLAPVLDELDAALRGAANGSILEVRGRSTVRVLYHGPPDPIETPTQPDDLDTRTCPYATTDEVVSLTGVRGLRLAEVLHPGDVRDGTTVSWTSCAWTDGATWFVSLVVHRGPHVPAMAAGWRRDQEDTWESGSLRVQDAAGPWEQGFALVEADAASLFPQSSLYVGSGDVALEAHILGKPGSDATALARHAWQRL